MKILILNDSYTAHKFIRIGFASAFAALGHEVIIWDKTQKSTYDAFDEFNPDLFWGQTYNLNKETIKCLSERPHTKVFLRAFDRSDFSKKVEEKYPVGLTSEEEIELTNKLREETGRAPILHNHYIQKSIDNTHADWIEDGYKVISNLSAANIFNYCGGRCNPRYESDICFVGGRWGYKSQTLDKFLLQFCRPESNLNVKIFGNQGWGIPQYCGPCSIELEKDLLASAKICPNISEPHSQEYGYDIVERPFKLLSNKCFCVSDYVKDLIELIPQGIIYASTPESFKDKVLYFLERKKDRKEIIEIGYKEVISKHTYLDRIVDIFKSLNLHQQAYSAEKQKEIIKEKICKS